VWYRLYASDEYNVYGASSPAAAYEATHDAEDTYMVLCTPAIGLGVFLRCATPLVRHPRYTPRNMPGIPDRAATRLAEQWHLEFQVKYIWVSLITRIHKYGRPAVSAHVSCI
jgi:hypothetical protein